MIGDFTAIIVTFRSEEIIHQTIQNLPEDLNIIIVENSKNNEFKKLIEKKYQNVKCILSGGNIGWGRANNIGIKNVTTKYILFLNPDLNIDKETTKNLFEKIIKNEKIDVLSTETKDYRNRVIPRHGFNFFSKTKSKKITDNLIEVDYLSGHIFLTKKKIFQIVGYFDENIFLNFEEKDLFKRIKKNKYKIFIFKGKYSQHLEGKSSNAIYQDIMERSSKWHYYWGSIYFCKKHYGYLNALFLFLIFFILNLIKLIIRLFLFDKKKINIFFFSLYGLIMAIINKPSFFRPKIN